jgi:cytochrome c oxidase cbb3-type subunit III
MSRRILLHVALTLSTLAATACGGRDAAPGRPLADAQVIRPDAISDFTVLYAKNCSGCHGLDGKGGAAIGVGDPVYLAVADDAAIIHVISDGQKGTSMPAFAQHSGGMLTDYQIQVIASGIRARWAKPDALRGAIAPPYAASGPGDPKRGAAVYGAYCSSCHGADGRGGSKASCIVEPSYLALVSDQYLRTTVIAGRPELGAPDWRGNIPGKPMSPEDVSDVVAWLDSQRPPSQGEAYSSLRKEGGIR